jgi:hypothetical protein
MIARFASRRALWIATPCVALSIAAIALSTSKTTQAIAEPTESLFAAPVCDHGGPYVVECNGQSSNAVLDGTGSFDPDGTPLTFFWFEECPTGAFIDPTSPTPTLVIDMTGSCLRSCFIQLRVTSGGQTTVCNTTVKIEDTTPPVITCPPDVLNLPPGSPTDPGSTGTATATDTCNPNPIVTHSDVTVPGANGAFTITRTWQADDGCFQPTCDQIISVLGTKPPPGNPGLDMHPTSCPNPLAVQNSNGRVPAALCGADDFDVTEVDFSSLILTRHDGVGTGVAPIASFHVIADTATPFEGTLCDCHTLAGDGTDDLNLKFLRSTMIANFQLINVPNNTYLQVDLSGQLNDGTPFVVSDCIRVLNN